MVHHHHISSPSFAAPYKLWQLSTRKWKKRKNFFFLQYAPLLLLAQQQKTKANPLFTHTHPCDLTGNKWFLSEKFMYHCVDYASSPFIQQQCKKKTNKHLEWMHRYPYYYFFFFVIGSDNLGMRAVPELKPTRQSHRFTHRVLFQNKIFSKRVITTQNNFDFIMEAMTTRY